MSEILSIIEQNSGRRASSTSALGELGEKFAVDFLIANGYRIVVSNFKVPVGRNSRGVAVTGEIDIIALDGDTICFVEVKTRRSEEFAPIATAVDLGKQRQIARTARIYRRLFNLWEAQYRFDVVTVLAEKQATPQIELHRGYWNESVFRKRRWSGDSWHEFA